MKITKTFSSTFADLMRGKLRHFLRRSIYLYAVAVGLFAFGAWLANDISQSLIVQWGTYFVLVCIVSLFLQFASAAVQCRRMPKRVVTFEPETITVECGGNSTMHSWDWILSAEETEIRLLLLIRRAPRFELFIPKSKLDPLEYELLVKLLTSKGKLNSLQVAT
jgi:hypothetical protein